MCLCQHEYEAMGLRQLLLSLCVIACLGAAPSRTETYVSGTIIDPADVTTNEDNIFSYLQTGVDTYATASISAAALATGSVASDEILDGTIVNADIATAAAIVAGSASRPRVRQWRKCGGGR